MSNKRNRNYWEERNNRHSSDEDDSIEEPVAHMVKEEEVDSAVLGTIDNCLAVNLRKEPNGEAFVIQRLFKGNRVIVLSSVNDWSKIQTINEPIEEGYIHNQYIVLD